MLLFYEGMNLYKNHFRTIVLSTGSVCEEYKYVYTTHNYVQKNRKNRHVKVSLIFSFYWGGGYVS